MNINQQIPPQMINSAADNQQLPSYSGTATLYRQQQGWPQAQQPLPSLQHPQQYGGIPFKVSAMDLCQIGCEDVN
jgi:hypothetical protein